jgi:hypothetical protein
VAHEHAAAGKPVGADLQHADLAHALTRSVVTAVDLRGLIADTVFVSRRSLPYPPGSGREGELVGFDRLMWYVVPVVLGALVSWMVLAGDSTPVSKAIAVVGIAVLVFVANPLLVRGLDRRRVCGERRRRRKLAAPPGKVLAESS